MQEENNTNTNTNTKTKTKTDSDTQPTQRKPSNFVAKYLAKAITYLDSWKYGENVNPQDRRIDWTGALPFISLHLLCFAVIWVGWSWTAVGVAAALYFIRMFAITGFYHRYFSHRSFKTFRWCQFCFAVLGNSAVQKGPLWWAAHHRAHHIHSDESQDVHSPKQHGFWWSHMGWFLSMQNIRTNLKAVRDLARYPELCFLDRFNFLVPIALALSLYLVGVSLYYFCPFLGTNGTQLLVWGFVVSTVVLYHGTYTINSLSHQFGKRRFATTDTSRNNFWLALLTLGEGWHNNHHHYPNSVRQGFYWWEIDVTYYMLVVLSWTGLIWDLKPVPQHVLAEAMPTT